MSNVSKRARFYTALTRFNGQYHKVSSICFPCIIILWEM